MANKRSSKSVLVTIIVTVIVLAVLSVIGIRYLMPYAQEQNGDVDVQQKIYEFAVRVFPLLIGIVLIIIASMIASNKEDDVDEDDLLPPNSYDQQLFESPSDDPVRKSPVKQNTDTKVQEAPVEDNSSDSITDDEFFAIFGDQEKEPQPEEVSSSMDEEVSTILYPEESQPEPESDIVAPVEEPEAEPVEQPVEEPVAPIVAEPEDKPEEPVQVSSSDSKLVDAVYALVKKLDDMTDLMTYEEDEEEPEEEYEEPEKPDVKQESPSDNYSALERKIDKLCNAIANLTDIVSAGYMASREPVKASEPPVQVKTETVVEKVEVPVDQQINDLDAKDPMHLMKIEFDSAQEDSYDITFCFTSASADQIRLELAEVADAFEVNGKTVVVIPFLSQEEALEELSKADVDCSDTIFIAGGQKGDFDSVIASKLG